MSKSLVLWDEATAQQLWTMLKGWRDAAKAGVPFSVEVKAHKDQRSLEQNRLYWARLKEISEQARVDGRSYSPEIWHEVARRRFVGCIDLPGGQVIGMSTTKLNTTEFSIYVCNVEAWAVMDLGVQFSEEAA